MLDFYLGTGGLNELGEHLGGLDMKELSWLQEQGFVLAGTTGHADDPRESLPYFDDVVLSPEEVTRIYRRFTRRLQKAQLTPGLQSQAIDKIRAILERAMSEGTGLSTVAD